jgi:DNA-binding LytR/AlgR family response regulator
VNKIQSASGSVLPEQKGTRATITIQTEKRKVLVPVDEILYIESLKEYVRILTTTKTYVTKIGITKVEESLDKRHFLRIHRSFLVALDKVHAYDASEVEVAGKLIPIGRNYKDEVLQVLAQKS